MIRRRIRTLLPVAAIVCAAAALAQPQNQPEDPGARYARIMADTQSFERFNSQLEAQVRSQEQEIASIERQLVEIDTTNREVQPLMQEMVDTLARFIELDLPFLGEERAALVQNLQNAMRRADVSTSEKYRMILDAYQTELEYGQTVQAYEGHLGTGADARTVEFVRLGRISLMYRTLDGAETGYWDANQDTWVVDPRYHDAVEEAIRVAKEDGAPELLTGPVPAPQEVRS